MQEIDELEALRFPIGKFNRPDNITKVHLAQWITEIESFPKELKNVVQNLSSEELGWKYRPEGWSIKQVVHHCADSHMNGFIRFKLALSENMPTIKPYFEARWAEQEDVVNGDVEESLKIIEGVHARWALLLKSLNEVDLMREFMHPEYMRTFNLEEYTGDYAWHSNHHLAHVKQALASKGKFN